MESSEALSASLEDYLEAIFHIVSEKRVARVKDISGRLKVSYSSVTGALRALAERDLVNYAPYEHITLTQEGMTIAKDVVRRHDALREFFVKALSVEEKLAEEAACRMEHAVPKKIIDRFIQFVDFLDACPRAGTKFIKGLGYHCLHGQQLEQCEHCLTACLEEVEERKNLRSKGTKTMKLHELEPGKKARITKVSGKGEGRKRIVDMGVTPGSFIEVERVAPLGDPLDVKVKGYHLSLRKAEASQIEIEMI